MKGTKAWGSFNRSPYTYRTDRKKGAVTLDGHFWGRGTGTAHLGLVGLSEQLAPRTGGVWTWVMSYPAACCFLREMSIRDTFPPQPFGLGAESYLKVTQFLLTLTHWHRTQTISHFDGSPLWNMDLPPGSAKPRAL